MSTAYSTDVLVVGAGPAGLTAAYELAKAGRQVLIIESDPTYVGGISRTVDYKGFLFDIGGHRFFSKSREVERLWDEILPDDFLDRPRLSRIYYRGKFYHYPLRAFEALAKLGLIESVRCVASFVWARLTPVRSPRTFHEWVRNGFGERLFSIFFKSYTEKVWGMSCDELSADWAAQRIKNLDLTKAVLDGLIRSFGFRNTGKAQVKTLIESFRYPRRGPGMMWEACARKILNLGGAIDMGATLTGLRRIEPAGMWEVDVEYATGETRILTAKHVVSSAPLRHLVRAMKPESPVAHRADKLSYRDFIIVALMGSLEVDLPDNWIYIHDPAVKVGRVQNFRSWSPEMVPDERSICLGLEYFCFEGDGLWDSSDEELIALARTELARIGLMKEEKITDGCVVRQKKAYPVYDDEYRQIVRELREECGRAWPNLHLVGRNGMHKYNNQDHAMLSGILTARNILAERTVYDVWRINEDAEYTEAGSAGEQSLTAGVRLVPSRAAT